MNAVRAAVVILALYAVVPFAPVRAAGAGGDTIVPSETCRGLWIVPVSYGEGPDRTLRMVFDTGASSTSVDPDALERILGRRVKTGKSVRLRDGRAGPLRIRKIKVTSHSMDHLSRALGTTIDGILGFPTFERFLLTLDYHAGEIRIREGALPPIDGRTVFRDVGTLRPYLALPVADRTVAVLVDSGSAGGLTLRTSDPLAWKVPPRPTGASVRYSGVEIRRAGRLADDLPFGPLTLPTPVVALTDGTRLAGVQLMHRFVWTFDQRERRIRMIPDHDGPIGTGPVRGTGLAFNPTADGLEVVRVFPDTPAEAADLREGDVVVAVDGTPVYERGCRALHEEPGDDPSTLTVERGGASFDVTLTASTLVP